jgi:L-cysteine desulfidase
MISGCICDGVKASCASKIAMGVGCGILGYNMYLGGNNFKAGDGIVGEDVEDTIRNVGVLASQGMLETDRVILKIMTE